MTEGDCFEANANYIIDILFKHKDDRKILKNYRLCHGTVIGAKGSKVEGKEFPHAWVEVGGDVILDFSNGKQVGGRIEEVEHRIKKESVKRYTPKQTARMLLEHEHYGPWE